MRSRSSDRRTPISGSVIIFVFTLLFLSTIPGHLLVTGPGYASHPGDRGEALEEGREGPADLGSYHTYAEMVALLEDLERDHGDMVHVTSIGTTYEGRDIWALRIGDGDPQGDGGGTDILILGGHHARELISVEVALGIMVRLIVGYGVNATITGLVDMTDIWFIPMVNPDGHVHVEEGNDWRKNRRPNGDGTFGVDPNRNYGYRWGDEADNDTSSETYCGKKAFSEAETRAVRSLVENTKPELSISYHSKGGYVLHPWGNGQDDPLTVDPGLHRIAEAMADTMGDPYRASFAVDYYPASGDLDDWLYAIHGTMALTVEMAQGHRPSEELLPEIIDQNLEGAVTGIIEHVTMGRGQTALVGAWGPGVSDSGMSDPSMDHPVKGKMTGISMALRNYAHEDREIGIRVSAEKDGEVVYEEEYMTELGPHSTEPVMIRFRATDAGEYGFLARLIGGDQISTDDELEFFLLVRKEGEGKACPVTMETVINVSDRQGKREGDGLSPTVPYGKVLGLGARVVNQGGDELILRGWTMVLADGLTMNGSGGGNVSDGGITLQGHGEADVLLYMRNRVTGEARSGYVVVGIDVEGLDCRSRDLVEAKVILGAEHDVVMDDPTYGLDRKVIDMTIPLRNNGSHGEEISMEIGDLDRGGVLYERTGIFLAPGCTVHVPVRLGPSNGSAIGEDGPRNLSIAIFADGEGAVALSNITISHAERAKGEGDERTPLEGWLPPLSIVAASWMVYCKRCRHENGPRRGRLG